MNILAVLTVRNEAAFLLEWLAHHQAAGVTDFLVFSNNCQDGTDDMLDRLQQLGHLTHVRNDGPHDKGGIQFTALKQADKMQITRDADWIIALDIDEFINVHVGDGTLHALLAALPEASAITLTWRLFGNADEVHYVDTPVTRSFTRCAPAVMFWPWRAAMFKTLFRNDGTYRKLGVHRPRSPDHTRLNAARWFDGSGRELGAQFRNRRIFSNYGQPNHDLVQLNHYPLGAKESFVVKADRGRAVHSDHLLGMDYWVERNFNTDTDTSVLRLSEAGDQRRTELLADPALCDLHARAVQWRHDRFAALMQDEPYRALFARLLMTPPSRPLTRAQALDLVAHANRGRARTDAEPVDQHEQ